MLYICIPTYDEAPTIGVLLWKIRKVFQEYSREYEILVFNDASTDATPETPGSIHEGGELGYSLSHAYGMALDNPDLIVSCVVGDGEAETGPLATAWHSNKFINPVRDGAVLRRGLFEDSADHAHG